MTKNLNYNMLYDMLYYIIYATYNILHINIIYRLRKLTYLISNKFQDFKNEHSENVSKTLVEQKMFLKH